MDLLQTVKKEGSRGGRGEFKWDDVKADAHRENYLGHSLMAPVGRWQRNRDLSWYAKDGSNPNDPDPEKTAADARAAEIKRVKEAEEDAMLVALGLPPKVRESSGANAVPVTGGRQIASEGEVRKAIEEGRGDEEDDGEMGRGRGFTGYGEGGKEVLEGEVVEGGLRGEKRRKRSRSRERHRERRHDERRGGDRRHHRERSRSRSRERHRRRRSRSRERERDRDSHRGSKRHDRSERHKDDRREERRGHDRPRSRSRDRSRDRARRHHAERSVSPHERRDRDRRRDW